MPALHIRNVDDAVISELKARAARNHRSLEGEVRDILDMATGRRRAGTKRRRKLRLHTVSLGGGPAVYSRDVIYEDGDR